MWLEQPMTRVRLRGRLLRPYWGLRLHSLGERSVLHRPAWIRGAHQIAVGRECVLLRPQLSVSELAWDRPEPALRIGDRVMMRPFASIAVTESVVIEDDVSIASFAMVSDDGPPLGEKGERHETPRPVRIGRGTALAERVAVLPGARIGSHCFISQNSVVEGEIPDYSIATGLPARVVGRTREP
jgi:serine acetyltransferase